MLLKLADFATARRRIGLADANLLASVLATRVAAMLPSAVVDVIGRDLVEVRLDVADEQVLAETAARLGSDDALSVAGVTVGIALRDDDDDVALIEAAEAALARQTTASTSAGTAGFVATDLPAAIARGELFLHYQPKLHVRRQAVTSVEALVRWLHPRRGLISPGEFIPAAERSHVIESLTLWTLGQVVADQRVLARNGHDLPVFVNIAGSLLCNRRFIDAVLDLVNTSGARLGFEITETSVIREPEAAIRHLQQLAEIGVRVAIDDYGAGLSSLAYLKQLPASELKIDKLFVTQLTSSHRDPLIVRSTIDLAHALEMEVVAEGVETPTSLALLSVMGCDMVQGFLISRPLALEALLAYLREERHKTVIETARSPVERLTAVRARA